MTDTHFHKPKFSLLIGVSITTILLIAIPLTWRIGKDSFPDESKLQAPYRYPFTNSLARTDNRRNTLLREITFYQQRLSQDPQSGLNLASLGATYLKMARATGENSWYLLAEQAAKRSLASLSFHNNGAVLVLARVAQARHDFPEAIRLSQQVLKSQPDNQDALSNLVTTNLALGNLAAASKYALALVDEMPSQGNFTLQALVKVAQGKDKEALQSFNWALAAEEPGEQSSSAWTRTLLGRYYYSRGKLELSRDLYREALRILPGYYLAMLHLAELETRAGNYNDALGYYNQITSNSKESSTVFNHAVLRGKEKLKQLQGKQQQANAFSSARLTLLQQEAGRNTSFGHRRDLARLLLETGRPQDVAEALTLMQQEVGIRRDAQTLDTLAWALLKSGKLQLAQQVMQEALRLGTRDAGIFYRAASIEKALGNNSQATVYTKLAREVDPTFDEVASRLEGLENFGF
ncbi:MAG: tetratricopeptide repeat protein [Nostocaceae cyanobacterium]|nr:tetratricopeptide repeat protein [Nostocaceae cyanobacterium]